MQLTEQVHHTSAQGKVCCGWNARLAMQSPSIEKPSRFLNTQASSISQHSAGKAAAVAKLLSKVSILSTVRGIPSLYHTIPCYIALRMTPASPGLATEMCWYDR